jgi:hypothetical protein
MDWEPVQMPGGDLPMGYIIQPYNPPMQYLLAIPLALLPVEVIPIWQ